MEEEKQALENKVTALQSQLEAEERRRARMQQEMDELRNQVAKFDQERMVWKTQMNALQGELREMGAKMRQALRIAAEAEAEIAAIRDSCNRRLLDKERELLKALERCQSVENSGLCGCVCFR